MTVGAHRGNPQGRPQDRPHSTPQIGCCRSPRHPSGTVVCWWSRASFAGLAPCGRCLPKSRMRCRSRPLGRPCSCLAWSMRTPTSSSPHSVGSRRVRFSRLAAHAHGGAPRSADDGRSRRRLAGGHRRSPSAWHHHDGRHHGLGGAATGHARTGRAWYRLRGGVWSRSRAVCDIDCAPAGTGTDAARAGYIAGAGRCVTACAVHRERRALCGHGDVGP